METGDNQADTRGRSSGPGRGELPIREHVLIVNDIGRGEKYVEAMSKKIRPGDVVLEVGTGAGLLTCIAISLGARHVYTVEQSPVLCNVARKVFAANGIADRVTLLNMPSGDLVKSGAVREPIDVFVTETIGTVGLEEGIAPIFDDVRPLLAPHARCIPETVQFKQCLVNMSGIRDRVQMLRPIFGFDMSALNEELGSNKYYWLNPIEAWREVSSTSETAVADLASFSPSEAQLEMTIITDNVCDGMLTWAEFRLAEGVLLETRYRQVGDSWANCVHFMTRSPVAYGQVCRSTLRVHDDRLGWTTNWRVESR
jgi:protein arginine N-methyltransferase 7